MKIISIAALCVVMLYPAGVAVGQILQNRPDLCGNANTPTPIPAGVYATTDQSSGNALLWVGQNHSTQLKGINGQLFEICPLTSTKMASFGSNGVGTQIEIIDTSNYTVANSFSAYDPATSPDRHRVAFRRFYAPQSELKISEEYLLYDFQTQTSVGTNRQGVSSVTSEDIGKEMYPAVQDGAPVDPLDVPEADRHTWRSKSFFWSANSSAVAFADSQGPILSLVLVALDDQHVKTYTRRVSASDVCGSVLGNTYLTLHNADITLTPAGGLVVNALFDDDQNGGCRPRQLELHLNDFQPAQVEHYQHRMLKEPVKLPR